ncbi:hypothetical protein [Collinsella intestinalis]|uniref:hypothetical protein n=1 Tax=Collinsella intestinalis TaxID=147207 RepID=UPI00195A0B2D|nr:hypothetical protein [Collinsella intestinalis]
MTSAVIHRARGVHHENDVERGGISNDRFQVGGRGDGRQANKEIGISALYNACTVKCAREVIIIIKDTLVGPDTTDVLGAVGRCRNGIPYVSGVRVDRGFGILDGVRLDAVVTQSKQLGSTVGNVAEELHYGVLVLCPTLGSIRWNGEQRGRSDREGSQHSNKFAETLARFLPKVHERHLSSSPNVRVYI